MAMTCNGLPKALICQDSPVSDLPGINIGYATKPVFVVSDKVTFKPACSATNTSKNSEISLVATFDMILSNRQIKKALIRLRGYTG